MLLQRITKDEKGERALGEGQPLSQAYSLHNNKEKLAALLAVAQGARRALIVTHNDPDPDAIGSAVGLAELLRRRLAIEATLAYRGIVGRAENKAMVQELAISLLPFCGLNCANFDLIALVDSQPGAGNQPLGTSCKPSIVVDHHPLRADTLAVPFWDVRPQYSSVSAMVTGYLRAARLRPSPQVATALFYGIKADTLGLSRLSHGDDTWAYVYLQKYLDREALVRIENASVPAGYFRALDKALHHTGIQDGLVVARLGEMPYPDMAAEVADFLCRLEEAKITVAVGHYAGEVVISVRSLERGRKLDELVQEVVREDGLAGGHDFMAAGRVPATLAGSVERTEEEVIRRFAHALGLHQFNPMPLVP